MDWVVLSLIHVCIKPIVKDKYGDNEDTFPRGFAICAATA